MRNGVIQTNHTFFDEDTHFTSSGHIASFNYIYDNYINNDTIK
jgi:hypothetical protein